MTFLKTKIDQRFSKVIHSVDEVISEILLIDIGAELILVIPKKVTCFQSCPFSPKSSI